MNSLLNSDEQAKGIKLDDDDKTEVFLLKISLFVNVGPCHHGMVYSQVADGGDSLHIWVAVNILNKLSQTPNKGWSSSLGIGQGANSSL
jgi:hypothetical protein